MLGVFFFNSLRSCFFHLLFFFEILIDTNALLLVSVSANLDTKKMCRAVHLQMFLYVGIAQH